MKKLFIYYSLTGNGDKIAKYLKEKYIDIIKVKPKKELSKNRVLQILTGGFLAGINYKDELIDFNPNINDYDELIIGSPIWNGRLSTPINAVLDKIDINDRKITFILYSGSGAAPKADKFINTKYSKAHIIHIKEPKTNEKSINAVLNNI